MKANENEWVEIQINHKDGKSDSWNINKDRRFVIQSALESVAFGSSESASLDLGENYCIIVSKKYIQDSIIEIIPQ